MIEPDLHQSSLGVLNHLRGINARLITAESCTGGLIVSLLTGISGASDVVEGGLVTYTNVTKRSILGVSSETLERHGAVSEATATEMAHGALNVAKHATLAVSVTGWAGPGGGSPLNPTGTVYICLASKATPSTQGQSYVERNTFTGDRSAIRVAAANRVLDMLLRYPTR